MSDGGTLTLCKQQSATSEHELHCLLSGMSLQSQTIMKKTSTNKSSGQYTSVEVSSMRGNTTLLRAKHGGREAHASKARL